MSIDKYNAEGYFDPVTYEALTKIEKEERAARKAAAFRPMVYICSPYSGDIERNTANARMYSRFAVAKNTIPFAHTFFFLNTYQNSTKEVLQCL